VKTGSSRSGSGLSAACAADPGRVRASLDDASFMDADAGIFLVSDGMGGHRGGGTASEIVARVLPALILKRIPGPLPPDGVPAVLQGAIRDLSDRLRMETSQSPGLAGAGATVVLLVVRDGRFFVAHLGDSRAGLFRAGRLEWLTKDHSVVGILEEEGAITHRETRIHSARGRLTRYVGMRGEALADVRAGELRAGDRILLCSDGLSGVLEEGPLEIILRRQADARLACAEMVEAANASGKDNVTALLVDWRPAP
jgi:protein phosphatase